MLIDLTTEIVDGLINVYGMKKSSDGKYLTGTCPDCHENTLWAGVKNPYRIRCNRQNNCSFDRTAKELLPHLYEDLNKKYPATKENPNYTADVYLQLNRGFDVDKINGWYEQGRYWCQETNQGTATVRFAIRPGVYYERFIDKIQIIRDGKKELSDKNFKGAWSGYWWQPPTLKIKPHDEIYLTEACIKAIALNLNGFKAVSIMSSSSLSMASMQPYLGKGITWVIALDNDEAGINALHKHVKKLRELGEEVTAALTSDSKEKLDWDDLHKAGKLTKEDMDTYRAFGRIEIAETRYEKAYQLWRHLNINRFVFEFDRQTYNCKLNKTKYDELDVVNVGTPDKIEESKHKAFAGASEINVVSTFAADFLYFQIPEAGDEGKYYFRLRFPNGTTEIKMAFSPAVLSTASKFKEAALKSPSAQFTGSTKDLDYLYRQWNAKPAKQVRSIDYIGYDRSVNAYIFNDFAVENGKVIKLNKEDYFQLSKIGIKTVMDIRQSLSTKPPFEFLPDFLTAYGIKGVVVMAWWLGSLFAEQLRHQYASYPFFEIVGDAGSGKSQMIDILSKLIGKDNDGFNPNSSASTPKGVARKLSGLSNMPIIFNETDNENEHAKGNFKKFSWDEIKDYYEGGSIRMSAVRTNDNSFKEMKFKAALLIVQNIPVAASEGIMSRIIHLQFDRTHHSYLGKQAADRLMALSIDDLSGFLLQTLRKESELMQVFKTQNDYHTRTLRQTSNVRTQRVIDNHAKLMALLDCLPLVLPISHELVVTAQKEVIAMAAEREQVLKRAHPIVEQFWYIYDYLDSRVETEYDNEGQPHEEMTSGLLNHSAKFGEIAINLEHFRQKCIEHKQEVIDSKDLKKYLPTSENPKFKLANASVRSALLKKTVRCWVFEVK